MACLTISNGETPSYPGMVLRMSSRKARSFFSVPFALLPATQIPKRIHHSSWSLVIRLGKLVGSTAAFANVVFVLTPLPFNNLIDVHSILEPVSFWHRLNLNLCVRPEFHDLALRNENLPAAIDLVAELADEQSQRS